MVAIREMTDVMKVVKEQVRLKEGDWVRLKRGIFRDDLAQVWRVHLLPMRFAFCPCHLWPSALVTIFTTVIGWRCFSAGGLYRPDAKRRATEATASSRLHPSARRPENPRGGEVRSIVANLGPPLLICRIARHHGLLANAIFSLVGY